MHNCSKIVDEILNKKSQFQQLYLEKFESDNAIIKVFNNKMQSYIVTIEPKDGTIIKEFQMGKIVPDLKAERAAISFAKKLHILISKGA